MLRDHQNNFHTARLEVCILPPPASVSTCRGVACAAGWHEGSAARGPSAAAATAGVAPPAEQAVVCGCCVQWVVIWLIVVEVVVGEL